MSKIGVTLQIDVTKIDKSKLFKGQKGTYLNAKVFIDITGADQYGNSGMITQEADKDEKGAILGNVKVFWREPDPQPSIAENPPKRQQAAPVDSNFDDDIPF